jgi:hypothetical protein
MQHYIAVDNTVHLSSLTRVAQLFVSWAIFDHAEGSSTSAYKLSITAMSSFKTVIFLFDSIST